MPAEATQEVGRKGTLEAADLLVRLLGDRIHLPFNAYDYPDKVRFSGERFGVAPFSFDLRGFLERKSEANFSGTQAAHVFVEVKHYAAGNNLLPQFDDFLMHAAIASTSSEHRDSWFFFVSSVPFGTTKGVDLCNGEYLALCKDKWHQELQAHAPDLKDRIALVIATRSFRRMLHAWGTA